jgi:hypothetical protein
MERKYIAFRTATGFALASFAVLVAFVVTAVAYGADGDGVAPVLAGTVTAAVGLGVAMWVDRISTRPASPSQDADAEGTTRPMRERRGAATPDVR